MNSKQVVIIDINELRSMKLVQFLNLLKNKLGVEFDSKTLSEMYNDYFLHELVVSDFILNATFYKKYIHSMIKQMNEQNINIIL